jgi:tetratricopeptide (TPR) repeat protein
MNDFDKPTFFRDHHWNWGGMGAGNLLRGRMKTALAIILLPAALALQACQNPSERAAELAQQADAYAQAGNFFAARQSISEAISLREDDASYHQLLGVILAQSGDSPGAYRAFQRALEFDATNRVALAYVANIGVQIGQINDAEEAADKLLTLEPNALPGLQVKGMIALSKDKYEDAVRYADGILAVAPTNEAGAIIKARALAKDGKAQEALGLLDQALSSVSGGSPALVTNKLNLYRYLKQPEPMVPLLEQLVKTGNVDPGTRLDQINLLYRLGRADQAREAAITLLAAGSRDPRDYRVLQRLWWQYDKTPIPQAAARNASGWKEPLAVVLTARYLLTRGDIAGAQALIQSAPARAQPMVASLKARLLLASGREAEAREQVAALLAKDDHDVDALLLRAMFARKDKQPTVALEAAQTAQTNDPLNPETYVVLADVYRAQGSDWRARQIFEEGLKNLPQNFYLLEAYTQYLHQLGDKSRATSVTRAFARAMPSSERAWMIFGTQCQWAGDAACVQSAVAGLNDARTSYLVDDPPGTPPNRGLFGRI